MLYACKNCGAEYDLQEIDFEAPVFCELCGCLELIFLKEAA
ncbi:MAG TPA: hypothetical protein VI387_07165 [Candidatus Brocadiales bacterium]|nr:hypothetical protein [Candidatus Brocadiales bacterium]